MEIAAIFNSSSFSLPPFFNPLPPSDQPGRCLRSSSFLSCMERRRQQPMQCQDHDVAGELAGGSVGGGGERLLQWSPEETREFLSIRAELDKSFGETKRNKPLWEALSSRMLVKGFLRTPDQCKSKWKNLLTRFKGSEAMEGEGSRQFPYYEEMRSIFSGRMQRLLGSEKEKGVEEEDEPEQEDDDGKRKKKKKKIRKGKNEEGGGGMALSELELALMELLRRQIEREEKWLHAAEAREAERSVAELGWRRAMEAVWGERAEMERWWRQKQEERRDREEVRSGRRDALISAIIDRLDEDDEGG